MYVIAVSGKGFFESMGQAGITFTLDNAKAFRMNRWSAKDINEVLERKGMDTMLLKVMDDNAKV